MKTLPEYVLQNVSIIAKEYDMPHSDVLNYLVIMGMHFHESSHAFMQLVYTAAAKVPNPNERRDVSDRSRN